MDTLKLHGQAITLVDQVEDNLLTYFRTKDLRAGMPFPMRWNWLLLWVWHVVC